MSGFTKLWSEITDSSIWNEDDKTRIVWITMLARMGPDYIVRASIGGLAHLARVSREDCEKALEKLQNPDPDSRSTEHEGRRIQKIEGGFYIINGEKFRNRRGDEDRRAYMREYMRKYRSKQSVNNVKKCNDSLAQAEAEAEAEIGDTHTAREAETKFCEAPSLDQAIEQGKLRGIPEPAVRAWYETNDYEDWSRLKPEKPWSKLLDRWWASHKPADRRKWMDQTGQQCPPGRGQMRTLDPDRTKRPKPKITHIRTIDDLLNETETEDGK